MVALNWKMFVRARCRRGSRSRHYPTVYGHIRQLENLSGNGHILVWLGFKIIWREWILNIYVYCITIVSGYLSLCYLLYRSYSLIFKRKMDLFSIRQKIQFMTIYWSLDQYWDNHKFVWFSLQINLSSFCIFWPILGIYYRISFN